MQKRGLHVYLIRAEMKCLKYIRFVLEGSPPNVDFELSLSNEANRKLREGFGNSSARLSEELPLVCVRPPICNLP